MLNSKALSKNWRKMPGTGISLAGYVSIGFLGGTLLSSAVWAQQVQCDQELQLTPDFRLSYFDYCTSEGDLTSLVQYYSEKCGAATAKLSGIKTRISSGESGLERFVDGLKYASNYYCGMSEERIRTSLHRQQTCAQAQSEGANCSTVKPAVSNIQLQQGSVSRPAPLEEAQPEACVTFRDFRSSNLIKVEASNQCGNTKVVSVCLVEEDGSTKPQASNIKTGKVNAGETLTFKYLSGNYSPYSYSAVVCEPGMTASTASCQAQCP